MKMMEETELIRLFLDALPHRPEDANAFFERDAESIELRGRRFLFTIDGFDDEDHFRTDDPYLLGRNLATGTVSDIFACGGTLLQYGHSVTVSNEWDTEFISRFSRGIADVITECGGQFAGGDLGCSSRWHYTGVAIGQAERTLTRKGARPGDLLYLSGEVGAGNVEAAYALLAGDPALAATSQDPPLRLPLRHREGQCLIRHASACLDTSDGLLSALRTLSNVNGTGYEIHDIPYAQYCRDMLDALGLPHELLMAGECGEYELLCVLPREKEQDFLRDTRNAGLLFHSIGTITERGTAWLHADGQTMDLADYTHSARQFEDHRDYLRMLIGYFTGKRS
jgi:thiamine-monophosphate kinase